MLLTREKIGGGIESPPFYESEFADSKHKYLDSFTVIQTQAKRIVRPAPLTGPARQLKSRFS